MILEKNRHICVLCVSLILGIIVYNKPKGFWIPLLVLMSGTLGVILLKNKNYRESLVLGCFIAAFLLLGFSVCKCQSESFQKIQAASKDGSTVLLVGEVYHKEMKSDHYLYYLKKTNYQKNQNSKKVHSGNVIVYLPDDCIPIGSYVQIKGSIQLFSSATNDGQYDQLKYYESERISFRISVKEYKVLVTAKTGIKELLYQFQKKMMQVFTEELNTRDEGILGTLVLGNKGCLDDEVKERYQTSGISHILAISGLHISILGIGIYRFLRRIKLSYYISTVTASLVIFCYTVMTGMGVSSQRAFIMFCVFMGAEVLGKSNDPMISIAIAAIVILLINPLSLFQSGFLFSFLAMCAIGLFQKKKEIENEKQVAGNGIKRMLSRMREEVCSRLSSSIVLQIFLLPITAWFYYEIPLYSMFLNLFIIPLCSFLLGIGLLGGMIGLWFPLGSKWILLLCHWILSFYDGVINIGFMLPLHQIVTGKPPILFMILYYMALIFTVIYMKHRKPSIVFWYQQSWFLFVYIGVIFMLLVFPMEKTETAFLNVGQGDGIYISDGGYHIMIDGGSSSEKEIGRYMIEPFLKYHGVNAIDAWIVTHGDIDHYSGLLELLEREYPVRYLFLSKAGVSDENCKELEIAARKNHTKIKYVEAGDELHLPSGQLKCLYPTRNEKGEDPNSLSQVWRWECEGFSVLYTGDIGNKQEKQLIDRGIITRCTVLKVAHHGSKYSTTEEFLKKSAPSYSIISSGKRNSYGHPHQECLERLKRSSAIVERTDQKGQITFLKRRSGWYLKTALE